MLDQLELCTSVQSFTLEFDGKRLAVHDIEEDIEVMLANLLGVVENVEVHLLSWGKRATSWLDLKDLAIKDLLLESLLFAWSARISPGFHLNL